MNEQHIDPVLDSLLEEMLTGRHPPDLSARIVSAWEAEQAASEQGAGGRRGAAGSFPSPGSPETARAIPKEVVAPPIVAGGVPTRSTPRTSPQTPVRLSEKPLSEKADSTRGRLAFALAACAVALLAIVGWQTRQDRQTLEHAAMQPTVDSPTQDDRVATSDPAAENSRPETRVDSGSGQVLELDDLPFSVAATEDPVTRPPQNSNQPAAVPLPAEEIVRRLDDRFARLWTSMGVAPNPAYDSLAQAQRIAQVMTGDELTEAQRQSLPEQPAGAHLLELAEAAAESPAFASRWSDLFVQQWLQRGDLPSDSPSVLALKRAITDSIQRNQPWNLVVKDLLGGEGSTESQPQDANAPNVVFVSALAGGENHRLVERIGSNFLNTNLSCVRCHDASPSPRRATEKQETYWSLVALLKGIDALTSDADGSKVLVDRQAELFSETKTASVFFDLPDGVLKAAEARLPNGEPWTMAGRETPRQALAEWISQSAEFERASVNQVWKMVFGRPLVPQALGLENAGLPERSDALEFLAEQFGAHGHDLKQLVGWIVNSRPFASQPVSLNRAQWLAASDTQLTSYQLSELLFAAGPSLGQSAESESLEASLAATVKWSSRSADEQRSLLAQPTALLDNGLGETPKSETVETSDNWLPLGYALHGERQTRAQRMYVNRLLRAERLSWEDRVEHVVGLSNGAETNSRIQHLAKVLLEQNAGDAKQALLRLLWAVQNSDAS